MSDPMSLKNDEKAKVRIVFFVSPSCTGVISGFRSMPSGRDYFLRFASILSWMYFAPMLLPAVPTRTETVVSDRVR